MQKKNLGTKPRRVCVRERERTGVRNGRRKKRKQPTTRGPTPLRRPENARSTCFDAAELQHPAASPSSTQTEELWFCDCEYRRPPVAQSMAHECTSASARVSPPQVEGKSPRDEDKSQKIKILQENCQAAKLSRAPVSSCGSGGNSLAHSCCSCSATPRSCT